jgi:hypothetical protein
MFPFTSSFSVGSLLPMLTFPLRSINKSGFIYPVGLEDISTLDFIYAPPLREPKTAVLLSYSFLNLILCAHPPFVFVVISRP